MYSKYNGYIARDDLNKLCSVHRHFILKPVDQLALTSQESKDTYDLCTVVLLC